MEGRSILAILTLAGLAERAEEFVQLRFHLCGGLLHGDLRSALGDDRTRGRLPGFQEFDAHA